MKEEDKKVIAVCMPLHDGKLCWETWFQFRQEEELFRQLDLPWRLDPIVLAGCSLIPRARNEAVEHALERKAEAVMWIDGDMNWTSGAIARLLAMDVDMVGAGVPLKQAEIKWNVGWLDGARTPNAKGLIEVKTLGTGFLFTKRRVYEIMRERIPAHAENVYDRPDGRRRGFAYFSAPGSWGEDTYFCHQWRALGGKVYVDPAITMQHVIAPSWSVKACLGKWLDERAGVYDDNAMIAQAVAGIKSGEADIHVMKQLYDGWGNGVFAATPDLLEALYQLARQCKRIVETGSGLSTLVMALANPDAEIHALEHDPSWLMRLSRLLKKCGVENVRLHIADIEDGFYLTDELPLGGFDLAVLDGPPRHIGDRALAYERLNLDGAILVVDDTNDPNEAENLKRYIGERPGELAVYGNTAKQFSMFFPAKAKAEEAA